MEPENTGASQSLGAQRPRPRIWGIALSCVALVAWWISAGWFAHHVLHLQHVGLLTDVALSQSGLLFALVVGMAADGMGFRFGFTPPKENPWIDSVAILGMIAWHVIVALIFGVIMFLVYGGHMPQQAISQLLQGLQAMPVAQILLTAFLLAITAALFEELLFRGYLISRLQALGLHPLLAGAMSALLFGLLHVPSYGLLAAAPKALGMGLVQGLYVGWRQRLWPGMIAHFVVDFSTLALAGVALKAVYPGA